MKANAFVSAIIEVVILAVIGGVLITNVIGNQALINTTAVPSLAPVVPLLDVVIVVVVIISAVMILTHIGKK
jgi:hypothetical protein